jgi:hypothetical protein
MTGRRLAAGGAALLMLLALILATLPARLAVRWLDGSQLALSAVDGSVWRGSAARAVVTTAAGPLHLGELHWRVQPWSLLSLAPRVRLRSEWGRQRIEARAWRRGERWELRDVDASLDAGLLRQLLPVELRGRLSLQLAAASGAGPVLQRAEGQLVWRGAAWRTTNSDVPLGDYAARFSTADGIVEARVETLAGPLQVEGTLRLTGSSYRIEARITAPGGMEPQLAQALSLIAEPVETGYLLRLGGELGGDS